MRSTVSLWGLALMLSSTLAFAAHVTVEAPAGVVVGSIVDQVEYFRGIRYAQAPSGELRLRPPVRASETSTILATGIGPSCPQMTNRVSNALFEKVSTIPAVSEALSILGTTPNIEEDCLAVSVMRPVGTTPDAKLPVLFWIHGGGYEVGSPTTYNGSVLVPRSVEQGTPIILVTVNYRLGGFGFLPGGEILEGGLANLGLLDQRLALVWVADNIAAFGGDPDKVTLWGQSAGSFSVFNQMALYNGDITYRQKALFRAGIMNSGSIYPVEPIDAPRAQSIFDTVVEAAGCASVAKQHKIDCLRSLDFEAYLNATNSVPSPFSYNSPISSFIVRPDGAVISASPEVLAQKGLYAHVPIIVGDQEDEGTLLSLTQTNLTTHADLITFLHTVAFQNATRSQIEALVATYPWNDGFAGSPFGTGIKNRAYPQFKRLAAILGDVTFTMMRRAFLSVVPHDMKAWSFISTYGRGTPFMGTFHTMDLHRVFYGEDNVSRAMQSRYIAFVDSLDPNNGVLAAPEGFRTEWPLWNRGANLIAFGVNETALAEDNFRSQSYRFIKEHLRVLRT